MGMSLAALAGPGTDAKRTPPQEPAGFIAGGVVGGLAAGPVGAVIGAGVGTWLGSRVHRAAEAAQAEARVTALQAGQAALESERSRLEGERLVLQSDNNELSETNRALTARLDQLAQATDAAEVDRDPASHGEASRALDGLQGDVLFRTGSAEIAPDMAQGIRGLAGVMAGAPALKVRVDGYADPRGGVDANLKLSEARAVAVRDLLLAAGVDDAAVEVSAYGKSRSVAADSDGYALERRVRLTLHAAGPALDAGAAPHAPAAAQATAMSQVATTAQVAKGARMQGGAASPGAADARMNGTQ
jgi:outer membrane protein OmpA-like peptidoglycan-associated protein